MTVELVARFSKFSHIVAEGQNAVVPNEHLKKSDPGWLLLEEIPVPMGEGNVFEQSKKVFPGWLSGKGKRNGSKD